MSKRTEQGSPRNEKVSRRTMISKAAGVVAAAAAAAVVPGVAEAGSDGDVAINEMRVSTGDTGTRLADNMAGGCFTHVVNPPPIEFGGNVAGVHGYHSGEGPGVHGHTEGGAPGPGVLGTSVGGAGVEGRGSPGVYANGDCTAEGGVSLYVDGRASFTSAGRSYVPARKSYRVVTGPWVDPGSAILITLMGNGGYGVYVRYAVRTGPKSFKVQLSKAVGRKTYFSYFVVT